MTNDTGISDEAPNFQNMLLADYRKIAFTVELKSAEAGALQFHASTQELLEQSKRNVKFAFSVNVQRHRERLRAVMQKQHNGKVSEKELQEAIDIYTDRLIQDWLKVLSNSKVPIVVNEISGHHLIAVIHDRGFQDDLIDSTDFVESNYMLEVKKLIREGIDLHPNVISELI